MHESHSGMAPAAAAAAAVRTKGEQKQERGHGERAVRVISYTLSYLPRYQSGRRH